MLSHAPAGAQLTANVAFSRVAVPERNAFPQLTPHSAVSLLNSAEGVRILLGTYGKSKEGFTAFCERMRTEDFRCLPRMRNLVTGIAASAEPLRSDLLDVLRTSYNKHLPLIKAAMPSEDWKAFLLACQKCGPQIVYSVAVDLYPSEVPATAAVITLPTPSVTPA